MNPLSNQSLHNLKLSDLVVMRGRVNAGAGVGVDRVHLIRDDHRPNYALRFIKGYIFQDGQDGIILDNGIACKLTTTPTSSPSFDASLYNEIAWLSSGAHSPSVELAQTAFMDIVDPTNLISHDLYAEFWQELAAAPTPINYLFIFQRVNLDDTDALVVTLDNYIS